MMTQVDEEGSTDRSSDQGSSNPLHKPPSIFRNMTTAGGSRDAINASVASALSSTATGSSSSSRAAAVLELAQETESSLKSYCLGISSSHAIHIHRADVEREVAEMKERSYGSTVPEVALLGSLVRRFIDVANAVKTAGRSTSTLGAAAGGDYAFSTSGGGSSGGELANFFSFLCEGQGEGGLVGWSAASKGIFWLRCAAATLSFLTFVILSNVHILGRARLYPAQLFDSGCASACTAGSFDLRSFRAALSVAMLTYIYSMSCAFYYLLPLDSSGGKYVPGLENCFDSGSAAARAAHRLRELLAAHSKTVELAVDSAVLLTTVVVALSASIMLERGARLTISTGGSSGVEISFTLGTLYDTFCNTSPACISSGGNTTNLIRAALAMMYIDLSVIAMSAVSSLRSCALQRAAKGEAVYSKMAGEGAGDASADASSAAGDDVVEVDL